MAVVVLAEDMTLGRLVALKRVHALGDGRGRSRVRREALVGASVSHPNLVSVYDVVVGEDGEQVIVMEYVEGETLRDALGRGSGLAVAEALRVIGGVGAGLDAIHRRGIVHRDVKPANILLGGSGAVKLADLGIASAVDRTRITTDGAVLGTFSYMAPEQLDGARPSAAVDVYALAAVAFEVLSGRKARVERNPVALAHALATQPPPDLSAVWPQAPRAAVELLAGGMSRDPSRRPRSAGELAGRLREALEPQATAPIPMAAEEVLATGRATARTRTAHRRAASAPASPRASPGATWQDVPAAAAGEQRATRRDSGGARRADAGPRAGAQQPSDRRRAPAPPSRDGRIRVERGQFARDHRGTERWPAAVERPPRPRASPEAGTRTAHARGVASRPIARADPRRCSDRARRGIVVLTVIITGSGSQPSPRGAAASRLVSRPSSHSRTTTTTSTPRDRPGAHIAATRVDLTSGDHHTGGHRSERAASDRRNSHWGALTEAPHHDDRSEPPAGRDVHRTPERPHARDTRQPRLSSRIVLPARRRPPLYRGVGARGPDVPLPARRLPQLPSRTSQRPLDHIRRSGYHQSVEHRRHSRRPHDLGPHQPDSALRRHHRSRFRQHVGRLVTAPHSHQLHLTNRTRENPRSALTAYGPSHRTGAPGTRTPHD